MTQEKMEGSGDGEAREKESLEGWVAPVATEGELRTAIEKAFDYRGDVSLKLRDGRVIEGYVFDRQDRGGAMADCQVRMLLKDRDEKVAVKYSEIVEVTFTGRDMAAGKSYETWLKKREQSRT